MLFLNSLPAPCLFRITCLTTIFPQFAPCTYTNRTTACARFEPTVHCAPPRNGSLHPKPRFHPMIRTHGHKPPHTQHRWTLIPARPKTETLSARIFLLTNACVVNKEVPFHVPRARLTTGIFFRSKCCSRRRNPALASVVGYLRPAQAVTRRQLLTPQGAHCLRTCVGRRIHLFTAGLTRDARTWFSYGRAHRTKQRYIYNPVGWRIGGSMFNAVLLTAESALSRAC